MKIRQAKGWQIVFAAAFLLFPFAAGAADSDIIRLGVMTFVSKAEGVSNQQARAITDVFTRQLAGVSTIAVIERERLDAIGREHKLNMSGLVDTNTAVEIGRLAGLQYMLLGAVTAFQNETSESHSSGHDSWTRKVRVTLDARVVDVTTGEVVLTMAENRENKKTNSLYKGKRGVSGSSGYPNTADVSAGAIQSAASRLATRLRNELGAQPYVVQQDGNKVHISIGLNQGVRSGNNYLIYADGAEVRDPVDGTVIDRGKIPLAIVEVSRPQGDFSVCDIVEERDEPGAIQPKHKLLSLSGSDARRMQREWQKAKKNRGPVRSKTWVKAAGAPADSAMPAPKSLLDSQSIPAPQSTPAPNGPTLPAPLQSSRPLENQSTDPAKVVATYPLSSGEANTRRIAHLGARKLSGKKAYDKYVELAESYDGDYLAAYRAGEIARSMGKKDDAKAWYDKALAINPEYKPAQVSRQKLK